jgi:hypothetical protein
MFSMSHVEEFGRHEGVVTLVAVPRSRRRGVVRIIEPFEEDEVPWFSR